jgi:MoaA/NifB/PqqE/SkfB family radical SAM enzyme
MCPREKLTRPIGFMSLADFSFVLDRIGHFDRFIHLHGYGEPLLDRTLVHKVSLLKKRLPSSKTMIFSTLGVRNDKCEFKNLIDAGLDAIVISLYGFSREEYKKIHGFDGFERMKENLIQLSKAMKSSKTFQAFIRPLA